MDSNAQQFLIDFFYLVNDSLTVSFYQFDICQKTTVFILLFKKKQKIRSQQFEYCIDCSWILRVFYLSVQLNAEKISQLYYCYFIFQDLSVLLHENLCLQALPFLTAENACVVIINGLTSIIQEQKTRFGDKAIVIDDEIIKYLEDLPTPNSKNQQVLKKKVLFFFFFKIVIVLLFSCSSYIYKAQCESVSL